MTKTEIIVGNCLDVLRGMESESIHCVITSPPYWGLRKYAGVEPTIWNAESWCEQHQWDEIYPNRCWLCGAWRGCLGLEPTIELYIKHVVGIFRDVKRVLRQDGTCWLNLGDTYAANRSYQVPDGKWSDVGNSHGSRVPPGLKPKDLCGIPWRVAFALQADGWWLRSDIIWQKPNVMPSSVKDRPTTSHEYMFLLSKSKKYYYDYEAIKEPASWERWGKQTCKKDYRGIKPVDMDTLEERRTAGRNKRTVWTISTKPFKEAHFATFPPALITPPIKAGTSERGCCPECGAGWVRVIEKGSRIQAHWKDTEQTKAKEAKGKHGATSVIETGSYQTYHTTGWQPSCDCGRDEPVPCIVLDPFGGAGTTALVANELGRDAILIEMSEEYSLMAKARIEKRLGMFADVELCYKGSE